MEVVFQLLDQSFRYFMQLQEQFGLNIIILAGDLQLILLVVTNARTPSDVLRASAGSSYNWINTSSFHVITKHRLTSSLAYGESVFRIVAIATGIVRVKAVTNMEQFVVLAIETHECHLVPRQFTDTSRVCEKGYILV